MKYKYLILCLAYLCGCSFSRPKHPTGLVMSSDFEVGKTVTDRQFRNAWCELWYEKCHGHPRIPASVAYSQPAEQEVPGESQGYMIINLCTPEEMPRKMLELFNHN